MDIKVKEIGLTKIMFLVPTDEEEANALTDFCCINTPLEATIKRPPAYGHPHIEIRKET